MKIKSYVFVFSFQPPKHTSFTLVNRKTKRRFTNIVFKMYDKSCCNGFWVWLFLY